MVFADVSLVERALQNLIENAICMAERHEVQIVIIRSDGGYFGQTVRIGSNVAVAKPHGLGHAAGAGGVDDRVATLFHWAYCHYTR